eukprot:1004899-Alexandrium_andersonii.AAC.1
MPEEHAESTYKHQPEVAGVTDCFMQTFRAAQRLETGFKPGVRHCAVVPPARPRHQRQGVGTFPLLTAT